MNKIVLLSICSDHLGILYLKREWCCFSFGAAEQHEDNLQDWNLSWCPKLPDI